MIAKLNQSLTITLNKTEDDHPVIGKQYHLYFGEGNINNKVIEIR